MKNKIPHYFNEKQNVINLVIYTAIYAELFILFFAPFKSRTWVENDWQFLFWVTVVVLVAMGVIAISRTIMYHHAKRNDISIIAYACWILGEVSAMALIYSVFPFTVLPDFTVQKGLTFFSLFREAILDTLFILLIPYTIITLVCVIKYKNQLLQELTHQYKENISPNMYIFYDEKGEMKLSVRPEMLYYIEAADNYIEIHYIANSKMQTLLVRNSLKRIETQFYNTQLIRCHRSYIVNIGNVQLLKKTKHELLIDFGVEQLPNIPVSRGYYDIITDMFSRTVQNETLPL